MSDDDNWIYRVTLSDNTVYETKPNAPINLVITDPTYQFNDIIIEVEVEQPGDYLIGIALKADLQL